MIAISGKVVIKGLFYNIPALVQIMAWCRLGDKPIPEPMMVSLLTNICVTRLQRVKLKYGVNKDVHSTQALRVYSSSNKSGEVRTHMANGRNILTSVIDISVRGPLI